MSMSINTNTAAMSALQVLNQTTDQLSKTQNAVSTGKSVSSASDSPAIYAISQTMNSQISALSGVSTGLQFAGQVLSTATKQASSISDVLSSMSETVTNAANNGENQDTLNSQL
ncbi:flagellin B, partial [Gluconobacter japonicus]